MATINKISPDNGATVYDIETKWGNVSGTLSDQTDLQSALDAKYNRSEANVLGAKNLLQNTAVTTTDAAGVTYTVNTDGTIDVSGTPTAYSYLTIGVARVTNSVYILSGLETNNIKWDNVYLKDENGTTLATLQDGGETDYILDFTNYPTAYSATIGVKRTSNNVAITGTIYPMLRLASDHDNTYEPYAMTNRQLTDMLTSPQESACTNILSTASTPTVNTLFKMGKMVVLDLELSVSSATAWGTALAVIPTGFRPKNRIDMAVAKGTGWMLVAIDQYGNINLGANITEATTLRIHQTWITS